MKFTFIFLLVPILFSAGCSSPRYTLSPQDMEVVAANYQRWSESPSAGSDIPERGIDLRVTVKNWPKDYELAFIVYNNRKSITAEVTEQNGETVVIMARIIQASAVLVETSETVDLSDRLVFTNPQGNRGYLPITEWKSREKPAE